MTHAGGRPLCEDGQMGRELGVTKNFIRIRGGAAYLRSLEPEAYRIIMQKQSKGKLRGKIKGPVRTSGILEMVDGKLIEVKNG